MVGPRKRSSMAPLCRRRRAPTMTGRAKELTADAATARVPLAGDRRFDPNQPRIQRTAALAEGELAREAENRVIVGKHIAVNARDVVLRRVAEEGAQEPF